MVQLFASLTPKLRGALSRSCIAVRLQSSARPSTATTGDNTARRQNDYIDQSISSRAASLPKASQKLRFTSMPYQLDTSIRPEPLRQSGSVPAAFQRSNPDDPEWPIPAWSCQFFSLNAVPPSRTKHQSSKRDKKTWDISPFPATTPRKSRQDFGTPSLALDHIVLQDKSTSSDEKEALLEEREKQKSYVMSLTIYASKKRIHKLAHVRNTVRKRIRAAIRLIVQGGLAPSTTSTFKRRIKGPAHYLLPGHRYTVQTSLELYRLPMDQLVLLMTQALRQIFIMGQVPLVDQALREECDVKQSEMQHDFRTADEKES